MVRPIARGVLSFGLVAIPVEIHTATKSQNVSFNLLHAKCRSRVRNQFSCPVRNAKGKYVRLIPWRLTRAARSPIDCLADSMDKVGRAALAEMVFHDKEQLALIRTAQRGLVLHLMFYRDEVRDFGALPKAEQERLTPTEIDRAKGLVETLSSEDFSRKLTLMNTATAYSP